MCDLQHCSNRFSTIYFTQVWLLGVLTRLKTAAYNQTHYTQSVAALKNKWGSLSSQTEEESIRMKCIYQVSSFQCDCKYLKNKTPEQTCFSVHFTCFVTWIHGLIWRAFWDALSVEPEIKMTPFREQLSSIF